MGERRGPRRTVGTLLVRLARPRAGSPARSVGAAPTRASGADPSATRAASAGAVGEAELDALRAELVRELARMAGTPRR